MATDTLEDNLIVNEAEKYRGRDEPGTEVRKQGSCVRWTVGLVVRLCIWYILVVSFLRCPAHLSDSNDSSPLVCKPYLIVRSHAELHIRPYYNAYGAPYIDNVRPYVQTLNDHVGSPAVKIAKQGYDKFGAPALKQAESYGHKLWQTQAVPRLQFTQKRLSGVYETTFDPYVQRAVTKVSPYYQIVSNQISQAYEHYAGPLRAQLGPFIGKTYTSGQDVLTTTVFPYAGGVWSSTLYFVNDSLWPTVTSLYSKNVEPQLVKIGHKLASYREGARLTPTTDESGSSHVGASSTVSASIDTSESAETATPSSASTQVASSTKEPSSSAEEAGRSRERVASDLQNWQEKFSFATAKGIEDLNERVSNIVDDHVTSGYFSRGANLALDLKNAVDDELSTVKRQINASTESLPPVRAPENESRAVDELVKVIREAAISIRDHAHSLREWHSSFEQEHTSRISAAVDSTMDILNNIRDLGLQEIGTRWARMDGVTYKDWARYYSHKAQDGHWRDDVRNAGMQHERLDEARTLSAEILDHGMDDAESAAKELGRLKDVGKWKIAAHEVSDNFDTRSEPPPLPPASVNEFDQKSNEGIPVSDTETSGFSPESEKSYSDTSKTNQSGDESSVSDMEDDELLSTYPETVNQHSLHLGREEELGGKPTSVPVEYSPIKKVPRDEDTPNHSSSPTTSSA